MMSIMMRTNTGLQGLRCVLPCHGSAAVQWPVTALHRKCRRADTGHARGVGPQVSVIGHGGQAVGG